MDGHPEPGGHASEDTEARTGADVAGNGGQMNVQPAVQWRYEPLVKVPRERAGDDQDPLTRPAQAPVAASDRSMTSLSFIRSRRIIASSSITIMPHATESVLGRDNDAGAG